MFLIVILGTTHKRAPVGFAGLAIGLGLTLIHLISIPVTNTSVNPARSTATALFVGGWALQQLWLFWLAPLVGAALAGLRPQGGPRRRAEEPPVTGRVPRESGRGSASGTLYRLTHRVSGSSRRVRGPAGPSHVGSDGGLPSMSLSDADGRSAMRHRLTRLIDRVASLLPTVRGRLSALVARGARAGARDPGVRRMAGARAGLRRAQRCVDASRPPDASGTGRPHHARRSPAWRAGGRSGSHLARPRRPHASWSTRCATIVSTTTS